MTVRLRMAVVMMILFLKPRRIAGALVILLLWISTAVAEPTITRGPYLQMASPHSMIVRWRTSEATNSIVQFGLIPKGVKSHSKRSLV